MDQAASVLAKPGTALHVSFYPKTSFEHIKFPTSEPHMVFLVAQSFVTADKHVTAPKHYNLRVVECTLAAAVLAAVHGVQISRDASPLGTSLRGFHEALNGSSQQLKEKSLDGQLRELIAITENSLNRVEGYTHEDVASILGISNTELEEQYTNRFPIQAERFMLHQRALHVFSEALRVQEFIQVLSGHGSQADTIDRLGELMNATQESCRALYDCSCSELDELCRIARSAGAKGSRLTGAGWGGCTVHLVPANKVDDVVAALKDQYYTRLGDQAVKDGLVVSEPGTGSYVLSSDAR
jgi:galactokinase